MKYYIVIPAYNEAKRIRKVLKEVKKITQNIIVVDDGSSDETEKIAKKENVMVLRHRLNLGQSAARMTGCEKAWEIGAEAIVTLDSDGQHDPNNIPEFINKLNKGYDVVFGQRNLESAPLIRRLGLKFGSVLIRIFFSINIEDLGCGFRAFTKKVYPMIKWDSLVHYGSETEMVARTGRNKLKFTSVLVETIYIDKYKGMTIFDGINILFNIPRWFIS